MPDLSFSVEGAQPIANAATPTLALKLLVRNAQSAQPIHSAMLHCQIQIEATKRRYSDDEKSHLYDLFGEPSRWGQTLHAMHWTNTTLVLPAFTGELTVDMPVPCTFDFNVAATKYLDGLQDGAIPLCLLFSGTVFYEGESGALQVGQVSWETEANFRLPVEVWREMMDVYYPDSAWLCVRRDLFDELQRFKSRTGLPSWERAIERLLTSAEEEVTS